jgi:hypothetical protein
VPYLPRLYPCTLPTAPVSRSFGLRSSYEIDILDTDQRPRNKSVWQASRKRLVEPLTSNTGWQQEKDH